MEFIHKYEVVFSKDKLDCGHAKDFVHRIHLTDDRPFRLPYRRVPPSQYQKLREALSEMEEKGLTQIIQRVGLPSGTRMEKEWRTAHLHGLPVA